MEIFKGLQPELVWSYFEEICKIPRPSKKEEKIAAWLMEFAKKHQLEARQDEAGNVLLRSRLLREKNKPRVWFYKHIWIWFVRKMQIPFMTSIKIR